jgi:uncharacterized RDD family membrane protein YckC
VKQVTYNANETDPMRALHGYRLASFPRRAAAFLIHLAIGAILFVLASVVVEYIAAHGSVTFHISGLRFGPAPGPGVVDVRLSFFENWYGLAWWVVYFGGTTYIGKGKTIGKRLLKIRVVSLAHDRLSLWHSVERALGYGASALEFGFGFAQYFVHPNNRTVHDRIAETIVVADGPER